MLHPLDFSCIWNIASSDQILKLQHHSVTEQDQSPLPTGDFEHISLGYDPSISLRRNMEQFGSNLCGHVVSAVAHLCHLNIFLNPIPSKAALAAQLLVLL